MQCQQKQGNTRALTFAATALVGEASRKPRKDFVSKAIQRREPTRGECVSACVGVWACLSVCLRRPASAPGFRERAHESDGTARASFRCRNRLGEFAPEWRFRGERAGFTTLHRKDLPRGSVGRSPISPAFPEPSHRGQLSTEGVRRQKETLLCQEEEETGHEKRVFLRQERLETVALLAGDLCP